MIFRVLATVDGNPMLIETIVFEGQTWLAPMWGKLPASGKMKPLWLIPIVQFGLAEGEPSQYIYRLEQSVPKRLLTGPVGPAECTRYGIRQEPAILFDIPAEAQ